jgi:predicted nucleic acid-binding protein
LTALDYALLDTSVFVARESGRPMDATRVSADTDVAVSLVTLAELQVGVLAAPGVETRGQRFATLGSLADVKVLPIDEDVAAAWARLRVGVAEAGRKVNVNDLWIAATAVAQRLPVVTQDGDFDALEGLAGLVVVRV